jgi:hemophore-related protein
MSNKSRLARRGVIALAAGTVAAGAMITTAPGAVADTPPNCTAADLSGVAAGVSAATSAYLFTHPDVNAFMTGLKGQPRDEIRTRVQEYLDANPQTKADIQGIRAPLRDLRARCDADDIPLA